MLDGSGLEDFISLELHHVQPQQSSEQRQLRPLNGNDENLRDRNRGLPFASSYQSRPMQSASGQCNSYDEVVWKDYGTERWMNDEDLELFGRDVTHDKQQRDNTVHTRKSSEASNGTWQGVRDLADTNSEERRAEYGGVKTGGIGSQETTSPDDHVFEWVSESTMSPEAYSLRDNNALGLFERASPEVDAMETTAENVLVGSSESASPTQVAGCVFPQSVSEGGSDLGAGKGLYFSTSRVHKDHQQSSVSQPGSAVVHGSTMPGTSSISSTTMTSPDVLASSALGSSTHADENLRRNLEEILAFSVLLEILESVPTSEVQTTENAAAPATPQLLSPQYGNASQRPLPSQGKQAASEAEAALFPDERLGTLLGDQRAQAKYERKDGDDHEKKEEFSSSSFPVLKGLLQQPPLAKSQAEVDIDAILSIPDDLLLQPRRLAALAYRGRSTSRPLQHKPPSVNERTSLQLCPAAPHVQWCQGQLGAAGKPGRNSIASAPMWRRTKASASLGAPPASASTHPPFYQEPQYVAAQSWTAGQRQVSYSVPMVDRGEQQPVGMVEERTGRPLMPAQHQTENKNLAALPGSENVLSNQMPYQSAMFPANLSPSQVQGFSHVQSVQLQRNPLTQQTENTPFSPWTPCVQDRNRAVRPMAPTIHASYPLRSVRPPTELANAAFPPRNLTLAKPACMLEKLPTQEELTIPESVLRQLQAIGIHQALSQQQLAAGLDQRQNSQSRLDALFERQPQFLKQSANAQCVSRPPTMPLSVPQEIPIPVPETDSYGRKLVEEVRRWVSAQFGESFTEPAEPPVNQTATAAQHPAATHEMLRVAENQVPALPVDLGHGSGAFNSQWMSEHPGHVYPTQSVQEQRAQQVATSQPQAQSTTPTAPEYRQPLQRKRSSPVSTSLEERLEPQEKRIVAFPSNASPPQFHQMRSFVPSHRKERHFSEPLSIYVQQQTSARAPEEYKSTQGPGRNAWPALANGWLTGAPAPSLTEPTATQTTNTAPQYSDFNPPGSECHSAAAWPVQDFWQQ